jgi:hypothetical protein
VTDTPSEPSYTLADFWREDTPINGPVYDLGDDCYGCRHPRRQHASGELTCQCCMAEHVRSKHQNAPYTTTEEKP